MCMEKPKAEKQYKRVMRLGPRNIKVMLEPDQEHAIVCCDCGRVHNFVVDRRVGLVISSNMVETRRERRIMKQTDKEK